MYREYIDNLLGKNYDDYNQEEKNHIIKGIISNVVLFGTLAAGAVCILNGNLGGVGLLTTAIGTGIYKVKEYNKFINTTKRLDQEKRHLIRAKVKEEKNSEETNQKIVDKIYELDSVRLNQKKSYESANDYTYFSYIGIITGSLITCISPEFAWLPLLALGGSIPATIHEIKTHKKMEKLTNRSENLKYDLNIDLKKRRENDKSKESKEEVKEYYHNEYEQQLNITVEKPKEYIKK